MKVNVSKIGISNHCNNPRSRVVYVEPWGEDYTLLPNEKLEIIAQPSDDIAPWFYIVESDVYTQVYCEATCDFEIWQEGQRLECGHNRGQ